MGLLTATDWTAQWLAAEDLETSEDRDAGLDWMWGTCSNNEKKRKFELRFVLPQSAKSAAIFATVAGDNFAAQRLLGVWLDGTQIVSGGQSGQMQVLGMIRKGEHLLSAEVAPMEPDWTSSVLQTNTGFAFFARFALSNGAYFRLGANQPWMTSTPDDPESLQCDVPARTAAQRVVGDGSQPWPPRPAVYLRREFIVHKTVKKARLYVTALGTYEARVNGHRVGSALLTPEPSQYNKHLLYQTFRVERLLSPNANVIALLVGDGWYASSEGRFQWGSAPRSVIAQLEITFEDGSQLIVTTDKSWRLADSPIRVSEINVGEFNDARLACPGWDSVGFDDTQWQTPRECHGPGSHLVAQSTPPIRAKETLKPVRIIAPKPGCYIFDFGRNITGWCRVKAKGVEGLRLELRFAELLTPAGDLDSTQWNMGAPKRDIFILRGEGREELFEPYFSYRGFRFVEVEGFAAPPTLDALEAVAIRTDLPETGDLRVDNELIQSIWRTTVRTLHSNFVGIPTDCPSREQHGWLADAGIIWDSAAFSMDVCAFTARTLDNAVDAQLEDGAFPIIAPYPPALLDSLNGSTPPGWGDAPIILVWVSWQRYGDTTVIERHWDAMARYLQFILDNNPDCIWRNRRGLDFGDWLAPDQKTFDPTAERVTPKELIGTAYWAHCADLLAAMALAIGRSDDAARLNLRFERVRAAFNRAYVSGDGVVGDGSQACYVLALQFGLLPKDVRPVAAERLASDVRNRGGALTTGFLGTQYILDVLADAGYPSLVYDLLLRRDYPSWGYMLDRGATTLWESWNGTIESDGKTLTVSQNHYALGSVCGFLFRRIAAIDAATPGFQTIRVRPVLDPRIACGGGRYESTMGRIETAWQQTSSSFILKTTIPGNALARIHVPASKDSQIRENRLEVSKRRDVRLLSRDNREAVFEVGSGNYHFSVSH